MLEKPSMGDKQYNDLNKSYRERYGEYKRDLLLWEQADALNKIQKQNEEFARQQRLKEIDNQINQNFQHHQYQSSDTEVSAFDKELFSIIYHAKNDKAANDSEAKINQEIVKYARKLDFWGKVAENIIIIDLLVFSLALISLPALFPNRI